MALFRAAGAPFEPGEDAGQEKREKPEESGPSGPSDARAHGENIAFLNTTRPEASQ